MLWDSFVLWDISALMPNFGGLAVYWCQVMCIRCHRCKLFVEVSGSGLKQVVEREWSTIIRSKVLICEPNSLMEYCCVTAILVEKMCVRIYVLNLRLVLKQITCYQYRSVSLTGRETDL